MPARKAKRAQKSLNYEYVYQNQQKSQFVIEDYLQNPSMIRKLNEEKELSHAYSSILEERINELVSIQHELEVQNKEIEVKLEETIQLVLNLKESNKLLNSELTEADRNYTQLQIKNHELDLEISKTKAALNEASRSSFIQFLVSTAAAILLSIGVNIVTTTSSDWKGWLLIVVGIALGIIAFFIARKNK